MKLLIILSIVAYSYGDKLDRTYLPPPSAGTAGGSPGAITAPGSTGDSGRQTFGQQPSGQQFGQGPRPGQTYNSDSRPIGSGVNQPSSLYGSPSGRVPSGSNGFQQSNANTASGFIPNEQTVNAFGPGQNGPSYQQQGNSGLQQGGFPQGNVQGSGFAPQSFQPERAQAAADRNAEILRYTNENDGERFSYSFETSNGISAEESGVATNGVQAQGGFSYTGDDGKAYTVTYTADENGYQPQGEHLPTPHPIPDEILKSIEKNAQAAAAGTQEGAYRPEEYENEDSAQFQSQGQGPNQYGAPAIGGPTSGFQQQNNQGSQSQGFVQPGQAQFNAPTLNNALNQALNQLQHSGPNAGSQPASGYQYNGPQANQYTTGSVNSGLSRPQSNAQSPSSNNGFRPSGPISSGLNGPSQNSQYQSGSQGPNRGPQSQSISSAPIRPSGQGSAYQSGSSQGQYQSGNQGYNYQAPSKGQFQPGSNQNLNQPQGQFQSGANRPFNQQNQPGSGNQFQSGSPNRAQNQPQYQPNRPTGSYNGQGSQTGATQGANLGNQNQGQPQYQPGRNQGTSGNQPIQAPYQYNRPTSNLSTQGQSSQGPQGFQGQGSQAGFNKPASGPGSSSEQLGGPRQPPSFNPQDGYTY